MSYAKGELFEICDALAEAEACLVACGRPAEARRAARAFDIVEAGLAS